MRRVWGWGEVVEEGSLEEAWTRESDSCFQTTGGVNDFSSSDCGVGPSVVDFSAALHIWRL